ncbi:glutaredoxin family protein [Thiobacillus sp.]
MIDTRPGSWHIIVYSSPGCPDCAAVKRYLADRGIPFEDRDITAPGVADEAKSRHGVQVAPHHRHWAFIFLRNVCPAEATA